MEFIEHDYPPGTQVSTTPYTFTWTPPSTNIGNVAFYVAGNAVNGNLLADPGDHVYTNNYVLTPAACTNTTPPVITSVDSASAYGGYSYFASGSWLEIKGTNLADPADPRLTAATNPGQWTSGDFSGSNAPTSLDGVSVSIDGKPAYVWYLSTGQLNVQAPEDTATGNVAITVTNCKATSSPVMFARRALAPAFSRQRITGSGGEQYMVATFASDGAYVLNTSTGAAFGLTSRPAKPGDLHHRLWHRIRRRNPLDPARRHRRAEQHFGQPGHDFFRNDEGVPFIFRLGRELRRPLRVLHHRPVHPRQRRLSDQRNAERQHGATDDVPDGAQLVS